MLLPHEHHTHYTFYIRDQIDSLHRQQVVQRRKEYTMYQMELLQRFLSAKKESTQKQDSDAQDIGDQLPGEENVQTGDN